MCSCWELPMAMDGLDCHQVSLGKVHPWITIWQSKTQKALCFALLSPERSIVSQLCLACSAVVRLLVASRFIRFIKARSCKSSKILSLPDGSASNRGQSRDEVVIRSTKNFNSRFSVQSAKKAFREFPACTHPAEVCDNTTRFVKADPKKHS